MTWSRQSRRRVPITRSQYGILPWRPRRGENLLDPHRTHATNEVRAIDLVSIPDDVLRCRVIGEGVDQLLACPLRGRTIGDVEVHDAAALVLEHEEHVQDAKRGCGHDKEVDGNEVPGVVPQKCTPSLRRRLSPTRHVPRHRSFSHLEADLEQLPVNPRRTPSRVLAGHSTNERPDLRVDPGTTASVSALPGPVEPKALTMPADHGLGLHEDEGALPVWPQAAERDPERAVRVGQPGALGLALQEGQLLSQGEVFESELALRFQDRSGGREQGIQQVNHRGRRA